ncbi:MULTISPECIES: DsbA family protein [unclassified Aliivibrio]|uniref:DsbA family protein n=1 Tax=unclassified Aliivibrio TaxID=2645654 RepID=UPI00080DB01C|nr:MULTISPECIES: DsbA family protein [unclassified Aliivibrio]OCH15062.1 thioredoxin [Aliivibrio sp. 1S128]OCH16077.1 thioredoxin [Aliivibrio sp. 1S165]OCH26881.1 thioredoxin [Aliivibrio sp. 1S175]
MSEEKATLYYVYDPMCSWCWGYKPTWDKVKKTVSGDIDIVYVLGGLAPDSNEPMPKAMQTQIASYWQKIENYLGTEFNHDFWEDNTPRRSTYPSCRAAIAAREQGAELSMLEAIQQAYYLNAKNPSDNEVLLECARNIGLNMERFELALLSPDTHQMLLDEIAFTRSIGSNGFPSLFLKKDGEFTEMPIDYEKSEGTVALLKSRL